MHTVLHFIAKTLWYIPWGIGMATIIALIGKAFSGKWKHDYPLDDEEENEYEDE